MIGRFPRDLSRRPTRVICRDPFKLNAVMDWHDPVHFSEYFWRYYGTCKETWTDPSGTKLTCTLAIGHDDSAGHHSPGHVWWLAHQILPDVDEEDDS